MLCVTHEDESQVSYSGHALARQLARTTPFGADTNGETFGMCSAAPEPRGLTFRKRRRA
jgi:hypothetical protein